MGKRSLLLACEVGMTSDQVCYEREADIFIVNTEYLEVVNHWLFA